MEENNGMEKTRDLVKKIGDTRCIFHAKTSKLKDRNGMDLTEAEDIKVARAQKNYTKKVLMTQITKMV